jgi:hypothetical protein
LIHDVLQVASRDMPSTATVMASMRTGILARRDLDAVRRRNCY